MRTSLKIVLILVVLLAILSGLGWLLPSRFHIERSIVIAAPPERVYAALAAPRAWKGWSAWNRRDPAMQIRYSGPEAGLGAGWHWRSASEGVGEMVFTAAEPNRRLVYRLSFPEDGMHSTGELLLSPDGQSTRLSWSNSGEMGNNPLMRYLGLYMDRLVGPDFEAGLHNLQTMLESA